MHSKYAYTALTILTYLATLCAIVFGIEEYELLEVIVRRNYTEIIMILPLMLYLVAIIAIPILPLAIWRKQLLSLRWQRISTVIMFVVTVLVSGGATAYSITNAGGVLYIPTLASSQFVDETINKATEDNFKQMGPSSVHDVCIALKRTMVFKTLRAMGDEFYYQALLYQNNDFEIAELVEINGIEIPTSLLLAKGDFPVHIGSATINVNREYDTFFGSPKFRDLCTIVYNEQFDILLKEGHPKAARLFLEMADVVSKGTEDKNVQANIASRRASLSKVLGFEVEALKEVSDYNYNRPIDPVTGMYVNSDQGHTQ